MTSSKKKIAEKVKDIIQLDYDRYIKDEVDLAEIHRAIRSHIRTLKDLLIFIEQSDDDTFRELYHI